MGGARDETKPKQKTKHPKQNGFKPGRWVGLDPFAHGHNKTMQKRSLTEALNIYMYAYRSSDTWRVCMACVERLQSKIVGNV